jgi:hypothetical protein
MRRISRLAFLAVATFGAGCATGGKVNPDEMSAAQHRDEAWRERQEAREHAREYDPHATVAAPLQPVGTPGQGDPAYAPSAYNPTEQHLRQADEHRAHARQHEKAAQALERFEAAECRGFPPSVRAACPLLNPVTRIDDVAGGVRVTFMPGTRVDAVAAHMRCHQAYARARAFEENATCPLYMQGVEFSAVSGATAIDITTKNQSLIGEVRVRSRGEAVYAHGISP